MAFNIKCKILDLRRNGTSYSNSFTLEKGNTEQDARTVIIKSSMDKQRMAKRIQVTCTGSSGSGLHHQAEYSFDNHLSK